ncbi:endonuclease/exonuclease/phosphatase family protein [Salipiger sp. IMCC34102]|uniref:endonuclease/exonuclease/phosphatase family protein n=1 Tax=Salipiger sp. IMCC34102 TaxID=2510647 RepID=UPI00101BF939|nr:endonuclease/exonuclease/phosphatase family protein [Salipiger sp. IMCC34102]RYH01378.1 endonuclease/exonuclease/phosphatase family protein [Salipiger sp. IMCC34102]
MIRDTLATLPAPTAAQRDIAGLARDVATHDAHAAEVAALNAIELRQGPTTAPLAVPFRVGAWNLERCLFPGAAAAHARDCDVLLLSEMDCGMARTAQVHTTAEVAAPLGMGHAYAVEFVETGLGSPGERKFCTDQHNEMGLHGNAVLARTTLAAPFALRLHGHRQWFGDAEQPRLGERIAIGARIETAAGPLLVVAVHLESASSAAHRQAQVGGLIDTLDTAFPGLPVLIGGDLNTGNHAGGDWRAEGLFALAEAAGFTRHGGDEETPTTRPSLITRWPERAMKLDWFLARGVTLGPVEIRPSLAPDGTPLSDHDMIVADILGLSSVG